MQCHGRDNVALLVCQTIVVDGIFVTPFAEIRQSLSPGNGDLSYVTRTFIVV
jgi:hypothetical protein